MPDSTNRNTLRKIPCKHEKIKYCEECVYYVCVNCGGLTNTMKPLKFWTDIK